MTTINVWTDDPVSCNATLKGKKYKDTKKIEFVFSEAGKEVARAEAKLDPKTGKATGQWEKAKGPDAPKIFRKLTYHLEVDGKKELNFPDEIHVWAKEVDVVAQHADGKGFDGAVVRLVQKHGENEGANVLRRTDKDGKVKWRLVYPAEVNVSFEKPFILLDKWTKNEGIAWEGKIRKIVPVALISPLPAKEAHKQYVNLDADAKLPHHGPIVKVKVGPGALGKLEAGEKIFLKALYGAGNSDRTPMAGAKKKGEKLELNKVCDDKGEAEFDVPAGQAGGDKIEIHVGSTEKCDDAKVEIVTWRRLEYEVMAPAAMKVRLEAKKIGDVDGYDFPKKAHDWFTERLAKVFVEFKIRASHIFEDAKVTKYLVDGSFIGKTGADATKKFYLLGRPDGFDSAKDPLPFGTADKRSLFIRLCDMATAPKPGAPKSQPAIPLSSASEEVVVGDILPIEPGTGKDMVTKVEWEAIVDATAHPKHPGLGKKGTLPVTAVKPTVLGKVRVDLSGDPEASKLVGAASATKCEIAVVIEHTQVNWINGSASSGRQIINLNRPLPAAACTVCHELGHNMGLGIMTTGPYKVEVPEGLTAPAAVPAGNYYDGHDHNGAHCATGLSDTAKKAKSFASASGTCIMFGSGGDEETPTRDGYCPICTTMLMGRNLSDIKSRYVGRTDKEEYDAHS